MNKNTMRFQKGFTLMEIMVVIIVVAVLASVAGPMITGITEQGKIAAVKAQMSNLKGAILNFNQDVGKYPCQNSNTYTPTTINVAGLNSETDNSTTKEMGLGPNNLLINNVCLITAVQRKWKGPYMEGSPNDFMTDPWGTPVKYFCHSSGQIYIQSAGPDLVFADPSQILTNSAAFDDVLMSVGAYRISGS
ncbi:MAG: prepilin-type N-terminal cleavage/methylation domain-containing protein [Candidatus Riflebacteria bacterium]|nr:prepilin-type N-terminal cleavage/methylation domain-containing protein [Candidatus Riflebacteria bacterium]